MAFTLFVDETGWSSTRFVIVFGIETVVRGAGG